MVTRGNCASACFDAKDSLAGIDAGNYCYCGKAVPASAVSHPAAECEASSCHGNHTQKCGGTGKMLVYSFACAPAFNGAVTRP